MTGINSPLIYRQNKYYLKYRKQRQKIVDKYKDKIEFNQNGNKLSNKYNNKDREIYKIYLKEIGDLLFKPKGNYQKFIWETISKSEKKAQQSSTYNK